MAVRLKVFGWSDGFHSWTVATSSRPKALEAWGADQDLFKSGLAREIGAGPEREAALASPGSVIRTGMAIDPGMIEKTSASPARDDSRRRKAKATVDRIQARIEALDAQTIEELDALAAERAGIDRQIERVKARQARARAAMIKTLEIAKDGC